MIFFPKTAQTILIKLAQNLVLIDFEALEKTACQNYFPFLRYSSTKLRVRPMPKWCPKNAINQKP